MILMASEDSEKTRPPSWFTTFEEGKFNQLLLETKATKEVALSNSRALRGTNGQVGLITRFEVLEEKVEKFFDSGTKILMYIITASIGIVIFMITTVIGIILYHVLTS